MCLMVALKRHQAARADPRISKYFLPYKPNNAWALEVDCHA